jgi:anhydro-N-acetylmuramic acid kinase
VTRGRLGSAATTPVAALPEVFIGLMSGTSMDGVDGVLVRFAAAEPVAAGARASTRLAVQAHAHRPFPAALREALFQLNASGPDELHRAALAANGLARVQADVVALLLATSGLQPGQVRAVGSHGQTVRHRPGEFDGIGYTLQLNQPALLAEWCGIDVVADFRSRDVAAGGQGAPLVPCFHAAVFGAGAGLRRAVLNLGGIANVSLLPAGEETQAPLRGFDCGPGNALMDHWVQVHLGQPFDADGAWAAGGRVLPALLQRLMAEPFLHRAPPKSTGRDLFHPGWLQDHLRALPEPMAAQDVQATLAAYTAEACALALRQHGSQTQELLVCGGGALNGHLMARLGQALPEMVVKSTEHAGLPPMQVEAAAFAWLARAHLRGEPGQRSEVTGARGPRVLGASYPANATSG